MRNRFINSLMTIGGCLSLCLTTFQLDAIGVASMKSVGMGGGGVAYPQDAMAGAYNPAGMSEVCDRADLAVSYTHLNQHARVRDNLFPIPSNGNFDGASAPNIYGVFAGANKNICFLGYDMTIGVVEYERARLKTKYHVANPLAGTTPLKFDFTQAVVAPVISLNLNPCHAIGLAIDVYGQRLRINGIQNFDNPPTHPPTTAFPGFVTNRHYDYSFGYGATFGYLGKFTRYLTVGVTYQPEIAMTRFHNYKGFLAKKGKVNIPQTVTGGFAIHVIPCVLNVTFDVEWAQLSRVHAVHNKLVSNLFDPDTLLGTTNGTGFGFKDQTFYRVGVDYTWCDITVRAGYRHTKHLVRSSQTFANVLTCETTEDVGTIGASYRFGNIEVTLAYAHVFNKKVKGHNSIPVILGGGELDLQQHKDFVGLQVGTFF